MGKTVKFAVSMPEEAFRELEVLRRKTGWTRSQFIREAIRSWKAEFPRSLRVKEKAGEYKKEVVQNIVDPKERRRRAIAAAGRFSSEISDLSAEHDKYLEEAFSITAMRKNGKKKSK